MNKNLLSLNDLSKKEILELIEFAKNFKLEDGSFRKENLFPDKTVANVFCEPSTEQNLLLKLLQKILAAQLWALIFQIHLSKKGSQYMRQ